MLIHVVCWRYKPGTDDRAKDEHRRRLGELPQRVPGIERFDVGGDVLRLDRSYDTGLVAEFVNLDALEAYNIHPEHQNVVALGREIAETVMSVDFYREG